MVAGALVALLFVVGFGPGAEDHRLAGPFDESLAKEFWRIPTPMDPATTAAFLSHRGDPKVTLHGGSIKKEIAGGAKSRQEPRCQDRAGTGQFAKEALFRVFGKSFLDHL